MLWDPGNAQQSKDLGNVCQGLCASDLNTYTDVVEAPVCIFISPFWCSIGVVVLSVGCASYEVLYAS